MKSVVPATACHGRYHELALDSAGLPHFTCVAGPGALNDDLLYVAPRMLW